MKEKLTFRDYFNVTGALAIVGFFGGMDWGEPMGKGVLYIALTVLVMWLVNRKKNARRRAAAESKNTKCGLCDWKTKPMCSAPKSIDFGIARAAGTRKTGNGCLGHKPINYYSMDRGVCQARSLGVRG